MIEEPTRPHVTPTRQLSPRVGRLEAPGALVRGSWGHGLVVLSMAAVDSAVPLLATKTWVFERPQRPVHQRPRRQWPPSPSLMTVHTVATRLPEHDSATRPRCPDTATEQLSLRDRNRALCGPDLKLVAGAWGCRWGTGARGRPAGFWLTGRNVLPLALVTVAYPLMANSHGV